MSAIDQRQFGRLRACLLDWASAVSCFLKHYVPQIWLGREVITVSDTFAQRERERGGKRNPAPPRRPPTRCGRTSVHWADQRRACGFGGWVARRRWWHSAHFPHIGRGDDTVGDPRRAQIAQSELFQLILLLKLYIQLPVEQFEATASQPTVPSPPLRNVSHW